MKRATNNFDPCIQWAERNQSGQPLGQPAMWDCANLCSPILAGAALALFVVSILVPCLDISEFGNKRSLSLLEGIRSLWDSGHAVLAVVVFTFTIVFPPLKLIVTILVAAPVGFLSNASRSTLRKMIAHLGKWSLLDVLVIAILIVAVKVQGFVSVQAAIGTYLFTVTILLSMLAGHALYARPETTDRTVNWIRMERKVKATLIMTWRKSVVAFAGLVLMGIGLGLICLSADSRIEAIRIAKKDGLIDFSNLFGNPSFYVVVRTLEGPQRLDTKRSTPIGGGLIWFLPQPVAVSRTMRIEVWNSGLFHDRLVDQVETSHRRSAGQQFQFELVQRESLSRIFGICTLIGGLLYSAALLIHSFCTCKRCAN
jgi:paraquat-inducible protein A